MTLPSLNCRCQNCHCQNCRYQNCRYQNRHPQSRYSKGCHPERSEGSAVTDARDKVATLNKPNLTGLWPKASG